MGSLGFVDWRAVNARFCTLMWLVALALAVVVLVHLDAGLPGAGLHHVRPLLMR